MDPFTFDMINNDGLLEEALVILDSIDVDRLGTSTPESLLVDQEKPEEKAAADDLLKTAVQAVHTAFPHNGRPLNSSTTSASTTKIQDQEHEGESTVADLRLDNQERSAPLHVLTTTCSDSTEKTTPTSRRSGAGRTRMREQLIQLRSVVQKMENHLETLRSPRSPRFEEYVQDRQTVKNLTTDDKENEPEPASEPSDEAIVWRTIAMQQFRARRKAEQQNTELRKSLTAQIQLSKQVENLLQAPQPHPALLAVEPQSNSKDEVNMKEIPKDSHDYTFDSASRERGN